MAGRDRRRDLGDVAADVADDIDDRDAFDRVTFTDQELTELALDAPSFDPFGPEVEPFEPPAAP